MIPDLKINKKSQRLFSMISVFILVFSLTCSLTACDDETIETLNRAADLIIEELETASESSEISASENTDTSTSENSETSTSENSETLTSENSDTSASEKSETSPKTEENARATRKEQNSHDKDLPQTAGTEKESLKAAEKAKNPNKNEEKKDESQGEYITPEELIDNSLEHYSDEEKAVLLRMLEYFIYQDDDLDEAADSLVPLKSFDQLRVAHIRRVVDGDTVMLGFYEGPDEDEAPYRLADQGPSAFKKSDFSGKSVRCRLLYIDTPESFSNHHEDRQTFQGEAVSLIADHALHDQIVFVSEDVEPLDQYGRYLAVLHTWQGACINARLCARGLAEAVYFKPNREFYEEMCRLEEMAEARNLGIWRERAVYRYPR